MQVVSVNENDRKNGMSRHMIHVLMNRYKNLEILLRAMRGIYEELWTNFNLGDLCEYQFLEWEEEKKSYENSNIKKYFTITLDQE